MDTWENLNVEEVVTLQCDDDYYKISINRDSLDTHKDSEPHHNILINSQMSIMSPEMSASKYKSSFQEQYYSSKVFFLIWLAIEITRPSKN